MGKSELSVSFSSRDFRFPVDNPMFLALKSAQIKEILREKFRDFRGNDSIWGNYDKFRRSHVCWNGGKEREREVYVKDGALLSLVVKETIFELEREWWSTERQFWKMGILKRHWRERDKRKLLGLLFWRALTIHKGEREKDKSLKVNTLLCCNFFFTTQKYRCQHNQSILVFVMNIITY